DSTVSAFAIGPPATLIGTLTGLNLPVAMTLDFNGNLYVANAGNNTVSAFHFAYDANGNLLPSSFTPSATFTGLDGPDALAFDALGNLYVANAGNNTVSVFNNAFGVVFGFGSTTPTSTLSGLNGPSALAFDAHGNLFVANEGALSG